jgi:hypothetical protein
LWRAVDGGVVIDGLRLNNLMDIDRFNTGAFRLELERNKNCIVL